MKNIFKHIQQQMVMNEIFDSERVFTIPMDTPKYPEKIVTYITSKGACKIQSVRKYYANGFKVEIAYKDVNTTSDFLDTALEVEKAKRKKHEKAITDRYVFNDIYRDELECPNWSSIADETGYKACPNNNKGYEYLLPEDSCTIQLMLQAIGYDDYADFARYNEGLTDITEELHRQYQAFINTDIAKDYTY